MKAFVGTKIIMAAPARNADDEEGYKVIYPDGYASWSPKDTFEAAYRESSRGERELLEQTDAEHQISAISDGDPERVAPGEACYRWIEGLYDEIQGVYRCETCGRPEDEHKARATTKLPEPGTLPGCSKWTVGRYSPFYDEHRCAHCGNPKSAHRAPGEDEVKPEG